MGKRAKKPTFYCTQCGQEVIGFMGRCPGCGEFNTMEEAPVDSGGASRSSSGAGWSGAQMPRPVKLGEIGDEDHARIQTGIEEFDFVIGGGIVPGSFILLGGEPGVGKSTILTQVADRLNRGTAGARPLYVSGEESPAQVKMRSRRLGESAMDLNFLAETEVGAVLRQVESFKPNVLIIDSIQTLHDSGVDGAPGGVKQLRHTAGELLRYAKAKGVAVFIIGHVTKAGNLAGPRMLEHMVDTVVYFENTGDGEHRIMRAVKNRFGSDREIGVFRMTEAGLEPVPNPSEVFLADRSEKSPGSAVTAVMEGSRPLLVEVQGLVAVASYGSPQRVATGFSRKRLAILLAVLEKRAGIPFSQFDVFLNVVGGMALTEPAADSAVVAALASSALDKPLPDDAIFLSEIGLGGELRRTPQIERRLGEAASLGFKRVFTTDRGPSGEGKSDMLVVGVPHVGDLIRRAVGPIKPGAFAGGDSRETGKGRAPRSKRNGNRVALDIGED